MPRGVQLDPSARIGRGVRFDVAPGGSVVVGAGAVLGAGCRFHVAGEVVVGPGAVLGERCVVRAAERVEVGPGCRLADEVVLLDAGPRTADVERPVREQGCATAPVVLEARAVLGPAAAVLAGVRVGEDAVVGARAVVTRDVASGAQVEGVPATAPGPSSPAGARSPRRPPPS